MYLILILGQSILKQRVNAKREVILCQSFSQYLSLLSAPPLRPPFFLCPRMGKKSNFLSVVSSFANPLYFVEYPANPKFFTCITSGRADLSILSLPVAALEDARCHDL